ncbi:MAG: FAD-dependent oxidoreductase [Candidatus Omnitrophica bacterium]|nr:FAD-dependent oxidoreductase [Candidatus Omnitrophota bacterium]
MKKITILGAGVSGLALIEEIRAKNIPCDICLIDKEAYFFSKREIIYFPGDISKRIDISEWAEAKGVEFIFDSVEKINPKRRKIYFKAGESRSFDNLVIASGLKSKKLPIKGEHREGFFYLSDIDQIKLKSLLKISNEACVYVSTWLGLKLAIALASLGKDVKIVTEGLDFLGEHKEKVISVLNQKNIGLHLDAFIEEAVGEGVVKAVKLSPLMVFSSQLVFVDSGFTLNLRFFEDGIILEDKFFTNFEGVYSLGDVNRKEVDKEIFFTSNNQEIKEEARIFAEFAVTGVKPDFCSSGSIDNNKMINNEDISKEVQSWQSGLV